ncbi:Leucine carboxyl methyltransferase 2 [Gamsiella multidivaricata]|nr:Leucine carboxyl methyltransferase 2 [Gamsiella multidivaricata]
MDQATDLAVQGTNTSSITSKRSLERLGYLDPCHVPGVTEKDSPFMLKYVVPKPCRRSPVINRAYYQRVESIRALVDGWIVECESLGVDECAVISLGCGFDPTFFRLATLRKSKQSRTKLKYIDIDYPTLIAERLYMVRNQDTLRSLLPENPSREDVAEFVSETYSCLGIDLRKLDQLEKGLQDAGVSKNGPIGMPILVVSEVVLAYLEADESDAVIKFFAGYPEENHRDRFQTLGWPSCDILNMNLLNDFIVMPMEEDHQRISQLEPFDEYDELYWIGSYYFIAIASTTSGNSPVPIRSPDVLRHISLRTKLQDPTYLSEEHVDQGSYVNINNASTMTPHSAISSIEVNWAGQNPFPRLDLNRKGHTVSILGDHAYIFGGFGLDIPCTLAADTARFHDASGSRQRISRDAATR